MPHKRHLTCTCALSLLAFVLSLQAAPASAFLKLDWDCPESQTDAECMRQGGLKSIFIYDEIVTNDGHRFKSIDSEYPNDLPFPKVYVSSRGGDVLAAMEIGKVLRRRKASIEGRDLFFPDRPAMCASACVHIAAGAVDRQLDHIGVHRPSK